MEEGIGVPQASADTVEAYKSQQLLNGSMKQTLKAKIFAIWWDNRDNLQDTAWEWMSEVGQANSAQKSPGWIM